MRFGNKNVGMDYNPTELLDVCTVQRFDLDLELNFFVEQILALMVIEKDPEELSKKLRELLLKAGRVSIGKSLGRLASVASIGPEFQGELDGLDALSYHLSGSTCRNAIKALNGVLERFRIDEDRRANK